MRFGEHSPHTAAEIVNQSDERELARIIREYGEERFARSIARQIVAARKQAPIVTTFALVEAIASGVPARMRHGRLHFATKTFQAIRIAANDEYESLKEGLAKALSALSVGGRIGVISFHSGEDRIVKRIFRDRARDGKGWHLLTKKPVLCGARERKENPKARSAKLRVIEKISE
jgi:16S rRNA (cytosine1402-N4)-methyltransferase